MAPEEDEDEEAPEEDATALELVPSALEDDSATRDDDPAAEEEPTAEEGAGREDGTALEDPIWAEDPCEEDRDCAEDPCRDDDVTTAEDPVLALLELAIPLLLLELELLDVLPPVEPVHPAATNSTTPDQRFMRTTSVARWVQGEACRAA
jgi:hypothetical protein